jgi:hypothetical protein
MYETASFAVGARSGNPEGPTNLRFVFWVPWDLPEFLLSVSELALSPVSATSFLFPAAAEFRFVETQLPVIRAWTVAIRGGILSDGGGRGSQSAVVRGSAGICAHVLILKLPGHQLRSEIVLCVGIRCIKLIGEHRESGSTEDGGGIHSSRKLLEVIGEELLQRSGFTE